MSFRRRLDRILREMTGPRITGVRFIPGSNGQYAAEATYEDGLVEILFQFDPNVVSFAQQELIGMTKEEALWLKDKKTDNGIGIELPA